MIVIASLLTALAMEPWTPEERKRVAEGHQEVQDVKAELGPTLRAFAASGRLAGQFVHLRSAARGHGFSSRRGQSPGSRRGRAA